MGSDRAKSDGRLWESGLGKVCHNAFTIPPTSRCKSKEHALLPPAARRCQDRATATHGLCTAFIAHFASMFRRLPPPLDAVSLAVVAQRLRKPLQLHRKAFEPPRDARCATDLCLVPIRIQLLVDSADGVDVWGGDQP